MGSKDCCNWRKQSQKGRNHFCSVLAYLRDNAGKERPGHVHRMGRTRARGGDLPYPSLKHQSCLFSQQELGRSQQQPPSLCSLVCPDRCRGSSPPSLFCFIHNMYISLHISIWQYLLITHNHIAALKQNYI